METVCGRWRATGPVRVADRVSTEGDFKLLMFEGWWVGKEEIRNSDCFVQSTFHVDILLWREKSSCQIN